MLFEKENQIRVINKHGLDAVIQLNYQEQKASILDKVNPKLVTNGITVKSVCQIDHFDTKLFSEKHAILDQCFIPQQDTFQRLVRNN